MSRLNRDVIFIQFISAKLLQQEDQGTTNIRIEWSVPSKAKIYFSWKSMMSELPDHDEQTLTFIKEEGPYTIAPFYQLMLYACI